MAMKKTFHQLKKSYRAKGFQVSKNFYINVLKLDVLCLDLGVHNIYIYEILMGYKLLYIKKN